MFLLSFFDMKQLNIPFVIQNLDLNFVKIFKAVSLKNKKGEKILLLKNKKYFFTKNFKTFP